MTVADRVRGLFEVTRAMNATVAGVLTFIGAFVGGGVLESLPAVVAAVGATIFATAAGNAINDYFDREIDAINAPERPIPRGAVSARGVLVFSVVLFLLAIVLAVTLPLLAIAIAVVNLIALIAYTEFLKPLPGAGNAVVAYLGGSTFLFGGAAVGNVEAAAVLFVLAALSTLAREIIKDVEDVAGDREEGLNTLPIAIGEHRSLQVATVLLVVAIVASPLPYVLDVFGVVYLVAVLPAVMVMAWAGRVSFVDPTQGQHVLKYGMFLAAGAFIVGRVAVGTELLGSVL